MTEESRGINADPEVRQAEYQEAEASKDESEKSRISAAMAALGEDNQTEETVVATEEKQEQPQEKQEETKSELYARLAEQDYQLQQLKKQAKMAAKGESLEDLKRKAAENPNEVLESLGIDTDSMLDLWMGSVPDEDTENAYEPQENKEIVAMKEKLAALETQQQQKEYQSYLDQEKAKVHNFVNKHDKWPLVKQFSNSGSYKDVLDTAMAIYQQNLEDGETSPQDAIPSYDVVLDMVEDHYSESIEKALKTAMGVEKFKHYFNNNGQKQEQKKPTEQAQKKQSATLTSSWNDTASPHEPTEEERMKNAIAAMESTMAKGESE